MPAAKPRRPAPGTALSLPRVSDETTQRAFDQIALVIRQLQQRIAALEALP